MEQRDTGPLSPLLSFVRHASRQPWFSAATAALGAIVGLFGSIFSNEIKNAFPFTIGDKFVWQAAAFYTALVIFAYFFRLQMQGQSQTLNESSERLERLIRTLPPEGFLTKYESFVVKAGGEVVRAGDPSVGEDGVKDAAQVALLALVLLAKMFDGNPNTGRYAINLMIFEPPPSDDTARKKWFEGTSLWEIGRSLDDLHGLLILDCRFALALSEGESERPGFDNHVAPLKLPVLRMQSRRDKQGRTNVLPGAPTAFCFPGRPEFCSDTRKLAETWRAESGLRPEIADEIEAYFASEAGRWVGSFVSLPVLEPPERPDAEPKVVGVVNIHSDRTNILEDGGRELFLPLATTFTLMLGAVVRKLNRLQGQSNP
ncbi:hypothetical protein GO613_00500 [Azoarcus communis]|uniref:hypothetical protein n=1 Tax=Parazoarcus communis TaxID=41977 RepID=UPI001459E7DE|nr:hypothetical protein [Parazoarcus communis]NMG46589.1 hypothetical protein [Parazoarcus communis]